MELSFTQFRILSNIEVRGSQSLNLASPEIIPEQGVTMHLQPENGLFVYHARQSIIACKE